MELRALDQQPPFTTRDGSTIRSILDRANTPVQNQSLAEATVPAGAATERHHHKLSEEFYFILEGEGLMEVDGEERRVAPGDAVLIPPGGLAPDPGGVAAALPVLLRAAVRARGHVFRVTSEGRIRSRGLPRRPMMRAWSGS